MSEDETTDAGLEEDLEANADETAGVKGGAATPGEPAKAGAPGSGSEPPISKLQ